MGEILSQLMAFLFMTLKSVARSGFLFATLVLGNIPLKILENGRLPFVLVSLSFQLYGFKGVCSVVYVYERSAEATKLIHALTHVSFYVLKTLGPLTSNSFV